jgi:ribonuclease-3
MSDGAVQALASRLGHEFAAPSLLVEALTHRSWCAEHPGVASNERLEFLGDAVLGLVIADHLFQVEGGMPEGELAMARAAVVSSEALAQAAARFDLGSAIRLGKGEDATGGRGKRSILADAMEAVIAAVYLDGGLVPATRLVLSLLERRIREQAAGPGGQDYKTRLQELAARRCDQLPRYQVRHEGPDHSKRFFAAVFLRDEEYGAGEGRSKKAAEQAAARIAWERLQGEAIGASPDRGDRIGVSDA